jgi:hypothetical protein
MISTVSESVIETRYLTLTPLNVLLRQATEEYVASLHQLLAYNDQHIKQIIDSIRWERFTRQFEKNIKQHLPLLNSGSCSRF